MPSAIGLLRTEFSLSLTAVGLIVSMYAALVAVFALVLGLAVARVGYARFAIGGVALAGLGGIPGMLSDSVALLAASRALEGAGWILAAVAMPALIGRLSTDHDRPQSLGLLGAFVPFGSGLMLLAAPFVQAAGGWRLSWGVASIASLAAAVFAWRVCRRHAVRLGSLRQRQPAPVGTELMRPVVWFLALSFFSCSLLFLALTSFLPTMLQEQSGMSLGAASRWAAVVILINVIGNLMAGRLLQRGVPLFRLIRTAMLVATIAGAVTYLEPVPAPVRVLAALIFSGFSGVIPGAMFASAARVASVAAATGIIIGAMLQSAGMGQLAGPLLVAFLVESSGSWAAASVLVLVAGVVVAGAAQGLRSV